MKKKTQWYLSIFLMVLMCISMLPMGVAAESTEDEKEPIETSLDFEQIEENKEETKDENVIVTEQTMVGMTGQPEEEPEENEEPDDTPYKYNEDSEPFTDNELDEDPDHPGTLNPNIHLKASFDGEKLEIGMSVTIRATIDGIPNGMKYSVQWRNNLSGEFRDVPGETDMSVTFITDERNVNCSWQLVMKVTVPEADV